jgi:signal transduction histidine kinase
LEIITAISFPRMHLQTELGLYRVCMELVNNTIRHAKASKIAIRLKIENDTIYFEYHDNGIGLPAGDLKKGIGHLSIQTRIHSMSGTFSIQNGEIGIGVTAELPLYGLPPKN